MCLSNTRYSLFYFFFLFLTWALALSVTTVASMTTDSVNLFSVKVDYSGKILIYKTLDTDLIKHIIFYRTSFCTIAANDLKRIIITTRSKIHHICFTNVPSSKFTPNRFRVKSLRKVHEMTPKLTLNTTRSKLPHEC